MNKLLPLLVLLFLSASCDNSTNKLDTNKDSLIQLQEARIKQLEQQLQTTPAFIMDTTFELSNEKTEIAVPKIKTNKFTIGSTEEEVLAIQGQPTSIEKITNYTLFFYNGSRITFINGKVDSYYNAGNLKISVGVKASQSNTQPTPSGQSSKEKKERTETKYIYFTFLTTNLEITVDPFTNELKSREKDFTSIYSISNFTYNKLESLESCITIDYRRWRGEKATLIPHIFDSRRLALLKWNDEKGSLYSRPMCNHLAQFGIMEQE
jgi:hypothetical protein